MKTKTAILISFFLVVMSDLIKAQENYRVDQLDKNFWRIQAIQGSLSTSYLILGSREALVIDACTGQEGLKEAIVKLTGSTPVILALTHGHMDHSGGTRYFDKVYIHKADTSLMPMDSRNKWVFFDEGFVFDLGDQKIEVLSIPGHTPGSVAFFNRKDRYMLTGDGIGSTSVWAHISNDPLTVFLSTLKRLEAMKGDINTIYVGHHEQEEKSPLTIQYITDMRIVTEKVLEGSIETSPYENAFRSGRFATYGSATVVFNPDNLR